MHVDGALDRSWQDARCDVCVIGCGPAGLVVASRLADRGRSVLVLESGGLTREPFHQTLNEGDSHGDYGPSASTRWRQVGGTVHLWNSEIALRPAAKYLPLDAVDFRPRAFRPEHWPFEHAELEPWYRRAQALAGLGPFRYDGAAWGGGREPFPGPESDLLTGSVYQFGAAGAFTAELTDRLMRASNVLLVSHATVVALHADAASRRITGARVAVPGGDLQTARADRFVIAAGAIESARLLLASNAVQHSGVGNGSGLVGHGLMEHPRDYALTLLPRPGLADELGFYDQHQAGDGTWILGRLALREEALLARDLPNASVTLLAAYPSGLTARLADRARRMAGLGPRYPQGGSGWSARPEPPPRFRVLVNLEQAPRAENRIELADRRDALGMPQSRLCWRWTAAEQHGLERLRDALKGELERLGMGRIEVAADARPDPRAHHHAGTLRMHHDAQRGVVDGDGRVHEVDNLYCAGAAVFPTAGFANPMLTILALALRLGEHLAC